MFNAAFYCHAECRYDECRICIVMLSTNMLNVIMQSIIMLSVAESYPEIIVSILKF
jgi:hypothetical protein